MKTLPLLVIGLWATACIAFGSQELSEVPVAVGPQKFKDGDTILIQHVLSTSPRMEVGDKVVVRGRYVLKSRTSAKVGLSLTQTENHELTRISPAANTKVQEGSGDFELSFDVRHIGCLHITFSSIPEGKSFGTVYFGTPQQLDRVRNMSLSGFDN